MLGVFNKSVAKSPEGLQNPNPETVYSLKDTNLARKFSSGHPNCITIDLGSSGLFAYSSDKQNPLLPRSFGVLDDILCLFHGGMQNFASLKQQYALDKTTTEVSIAIEAYRTLRDRGPYPAHQVISDFEGKFAFILFDNSTKNAVIASDADGSIPFYWGTDSEGHLVISGDLEIMKSGCGNSFAPFPKGCIYTSSGGLRSFTRPNKELKAVPWLDVWVKFVVQILRWTQIHHASRKSGCLGLEARETGLFKFEIRQTLR